MLLADKDSDSTVVPIGAGKRASRRRKPDPATAPAGPPFSP
jgi:hypothetical protein